MNKYKEFQESFITLFKSLFEAMKGKSNKELDDALILHGETEEQRQIIQEICQDVDMEHDMIEEMINSDRTPGEFLERDIKDAVKEMNPDATDEDIDRIIEATMDAMEEDIEQGSKELIKEAGLDETMQEEDIEQDDPETPEEASQSAEGKQINLITETEEDK